MNKAITLAALNHYHQALRVQAQEAMERVRFLQDNEQATEPEKHDAEIVWQGITNDIGLVAEEIEQVEKRLTADSQRTAKASDKRAADGQPRLYEVSALVSYTAVICAMSSKDALAEVETWENAWHDTADLIGVSDVEVTHTRPVQDAQSEAHDITREASKALAKGQSEE